MQIRIGAQFAVGGDSDLDAKTDAVMDELLEIEEATGVTSHSDVSASLRDRIVEVSVVVSADTLEAAQELGSTFIRQAIERAGSNVASPKTRSRQTEDSIFTLEGSKQEALV